MQKTFSPSPELNQDIYTYDRGHTSSSTRGGPNFHSNPRNNQGCRIHHKGKLVTKSMTVSHEKDSPVDSKSPSEISESILARRILLQSMQTRQDDLIAQLPLNHNQILELNQLKYDDDQRKKVTSFDGGHAKKEHYGVANSITKVMTAHRDRLRQIYTPPKEHKVQIVQQQKNFQSENVTIKGVSVTVKLPQQFNQVLAQKKIETHHSQHRDASSNENSFIAITDEPTSEENRSNSQMKDCQSATNPRFQLKIIRNNKQDALKTWQPDTDGSLLQSTLTSQRNGNVIRDSQNNSENVQQTKQLKMCLKKFATLKDPVQTIRKITDGIFTGEELGIPFSRLSQRRNHLQISSMLDKRPVTQGNAGMSRTIQIIDDQPETSKLASGQEHAFQQSKQLGEFLNPKCYNSANCERFMYPTLDNFKSIRKIQRNNNKILQAMTLQSSRDRSINIDNLTYHDQKVFFRLDNAYEKTFVQKHESKIKKSQDQLSKGLMANLKRERINIFKQFLNEDQSRKIDYNKTSFNSKVPYLRTPKLRVLMQGDEMKGAHSGMLVKQRDDIIKKNQPFRQRQVRQV